MCQAMAMLLLVTGLPVLLSALAAALQVRRLVQEMKTVSTPGRAAAATAASSIEASLTAATSGSVARLNESRQLHSKNNYYCLQFALK